jgi:hypothetical protein
MALGALQIGLHYDHNMAGFDPELSVEVTGNHIFVTLGLAIR